MLPEPRGDVLLGHLPRWAGEPVALLEEGARLGRVFALRLGVPGVLGFSPEWNRRFLTDVEAFVSAGSFSRVVPHLAGGVILTDAPAHAARRVVLNEPFSRSRLEVLRERVRRVAWEAQPVGVFDAVAWADDVVRDALNAVYFGGEFPPALLGAFLRPLRLAFPGPMLPRPVLFARVDRVLRRLAERRLRSGGRDDVLGVLARVPGGVLEARVSLAAAHDTTTHALAWAVWFLAGFPEWRREEGVRPALREVLRLFPPGWVGSRRVARDVEFGGCLLRRGSLALYSPFLSGRDEGVWNAPLAFRPERWERPPPAWSYLPFGGGERTCLGMHLANLILEECLAVFLSGDLTRVRGEERARPGVTLGPAGPLVVRFRP